MADASATQQFRALSSFLTDIGLGQLFSLDSSGNPSGWLWNQIQAGIDNEQELELALRQTDVFKERFGIIEEQQKRAARGENVHVFSPKEVLAYERETKQIMQAAGLPSSFYDEPSDFHQLILRDMSAAEVAERVTQAFDYVLAAPPEVREAFNEYYGVGNGDAQLAAWALDPDRTVRDINKATRTAYAGGMAQRYDIEMDKQAAQRIAELPMTEAGINEGMKQVSSLRPAFREGLGDRGTDLTDQTGVDMVFEGDGDAQQALSRRVLRRGAGNRTSTGGAATTQEGVVGVGSS